VACFVKTPELSPVKTRLAKGIGGDRALEFYRRACDAVAAVLAEAAAGDAPKVVPYWAVAEAAGASAWGRFATVGQGEGDLGVRLEAVYGAWMAPGRAVGLIGADAPQITARCFEAAWQLLGSGSDYVIGPAADGGFYLLVGAQPIPRGVWTSIAYSVSTTAKALASALATTGGRVSWLAPLTDVDEAADLPALARELAGLPVLLPEQEELLDWVQKVLRVSQGV
jgi:rSAM/selenodomain-associated transferase 1